MTEAIFLILLSFIVIGTGILFILRYRNISSNGIEADGIIYDFSSTPVTNSITSNSSKKFPIVRFLTEKNEWITEKASVSFIPGSYKKGHKITVVYLVDNPTVFFIKSSQTKFVLTNMITISSLLLMYGMYTLINI